MAFDFGMMNPEQKQAVMHLDGPCRVIAGAGSGKTTVLTKRVQYMIQEGHISPKNILAITFTNKAAKEMKERLIKLIGKPGEDVFMGTFHSFGLQVLKAKNRKAKKERQNFMEGSMQFQIMNRILSKNTNVLKTPIQSEISPEVAISFVSWQKNYLILPGDKLDMSCLDDDMELTPELEEDFQKIYKAYEMLKDREGVIDFDDMLVQSYLALKRDRELREMFINIYKYILVDEFQDTNVAQYKMIKLLAGYRNNVFIVGDARQAIYSWRASKVDFILDFEKEWKKARTIELNDNYRSTVEVVEMSTLSIKRSSIEYPGICRSGRGNHGDPIYSFRTEDEVGEADMVAYIIDDFVNNQKKIQYSDVAVLYRLNAQSRPFEDAFMALGIPYYVAGSEGFYGMREIKELLTYLKLAQDPSDTESFKNIINVPDRGVTKETIMALEQKSIQYETPIVDTVMSFYDVDDNASKDMLLDFAMTIKKVQEMNDDPNCSIADMLAEFCDNSGYYEFIKERDKKKAKGNGDKDGKGDMIRSFIKSCDRHKTIKDFFEYVKRVEDQQANNAKEKVQLMSLHRSKGLEFNTVFMVGMVNGLLPHGKSMKTDQNGNIIMESIEEERRLCYVGITRAKERLFMSGFERQGTKEMQESIFYHEVHPNTKDISEIYEEVKKMKSVQEEREAQEKEQNS